MSDLVERLRGRKEARKVDGSIQRTWAATKLDIEAADKIAELEAALAFYADPETYHACSFMFDRPTGGFDDDFSDDHGHEDYNRPMPGMVARNALKDKA